LKFFFLKKKAQVHCFAQLLNGILHLICWKLLSFFRARWRHSNPLHLHILVATLRQYRLNGWKTGLTANIKV